METPALPFPAFTIAYTINGIGVALQVASNQLAQFED
jgi:hypothetical protein